MGFSRQEHWSGLPCPLPGDLPNPGIEPMSPASPELAGRFFTTEPPGKPYSGGPSGKEPAASAGDITDVGSIPGLGRSSGGGHGNPLQYSCLEILTDRGAWQATVHGVTKIKNHQLTHTADPPYLEQCLAQSSTHFIFIQ